MAEYVDITPKWVEILPTWLMMFEQAVEGNCMNPDLVKSNAKAELRRMAEGADCYADLVAFLRHSEGWSDKAIFGALNIGRGISEQRKQETAR